MLRRISPTEGAVNIAGHDISRIRESRLPHMRRAIGMVFQDPALDDRLTAWENLEIHAVLYEDVAPRDAAAALMRRPVPAESG